MTPIIISIEGNIGSGKSSLVTALEEYWVQDSNSLRVCFLQEPVEEWNKITDENGCTILERYYADQATYAFSFQMMAYISRLKKIKDALLEDYDIIIMERSLETDRRVFAQMLKDEDKISQIEFTIYNEWFDYFLKDIPDFHIVYVRTDPLVAHARVKKRNRPGENIPLEYLKTCHQYHEQWYTESQDQWKYNLWRPGNWLVLDGNIDTEKHPATLIHHIKLIQTMVMDKSV